MDTSDSLRVSPSPASRVLLVCQRSKRWCKVQNVPQGMLDFGMSGSFGTKDQPGLFSSPAAVDATTVLDYLESNDTPASAAKTESERVSETLAQSGPGRVAKHGGTYSQGDFFAQPEPAAPTAGEATADAASRAVSRAKTGTGLPAVSDDLARRLKGDWRALARELDSNSTRGVAQPRPFPS